MGCKQQVHRCCPDRQFLFPQRDLVVGNGGGEDDDERRCLVGEFLGLGEVGGKRVGIMFGKGAGEEVGIDLPKRAPTANARFSSVMSTDV